jgi:hypothetical protein
MKKFIIKTSLFILPFIFLYILNTFLYNQKEGALIRLGYLYSNPTPKSSINSQYNFTKQYTLLSEIDVRDTNKFDVITIGDSYSQQDSLGYQNFLANKGLKVLHIAPFISGTNPIQAIVNLLNSNLFDYVSADYLVVQSVERSFIRRATKIDLDTTTNLKRISNRINRFNKRIKNNPKRIPNYNLQFFSRATFEIPITNIQYNFQPKPKYSKTYRYTSISNDLFSNGPNELLFYEADVRLMGVKNDSLNIMRSIDVVERISEKAAKRNMKLVMLISPDKYDLYFNYIKDNENLTTPRFFEIYEQAQKDYINIDSYKVLTGKIKQEKDIYFYDGTHWSPIGAGIIADEIFEIVNRQNTNAQRGI